MGKKWKESIVSLYYKTNPNCCVLKPIHEEQLWNRICKPKCKASLQCTTDPKSVSQARKPKVEILNSTTLTSFSVEDPFSPRHIYILYLPHTHASRLCSQSQSHSSNHHPTLQSLSKDFTAAAPKYSKCLCQVLVWTRYFSLNPHTWLLQGLWDTSPPLSWAETTTTSLGLSEPQPPPSIAKPAVYCNIKGYINYIHHFFFSFSISFVTMVLGLYP